MLTKTNLTMIRKSEALPSCISKTDTLNYNNEQVKAKHSQILSISRHASGLLGAGSRTDRAKIQHNALKIGLLDRRETLCSVEKERSWLTRCSVYVERTRQEKNGLRTEIAHFVLTSVICKDRHDSKMESQESLYILGCCARTTRKGNVWIHYIAGGFLAPRNHSLAPWTGRIDETAGMIT